MLFADLSGDEKAEIKKLELKLLCPAYCKSRKLDNVYRVSKKMISNCREKACP